MLHVTVLETSKFAVDRLRLERIARAALEAEGASADAELSVAIGDDAWIRKLNQKYKQKDEPTDVLAFPQGEPALLGDVAISAETAQRQARELGHSVSQELEILLIHGILHLMGWTDDTPTRRKRMMARTEQILTEMDTRAEP